MYLEEQETNINYNASELNAVAYTAYPRDINRFKKLVQEYPNDVKLIREDENGITISVPKNWVKVSKPRQVNMSEERKQQLRESLEKIRAKNNN